MRSDSCQNQRAARPFEFLRADAGTGTCRKFPSPLAEGIPFQNWFPSAMRLPSLEPPCVNTWDQGRSAKAHPICSKLSPVVFVPALVVPKKGGGMDHRLCHPGELRDALAWLESVLRFYRSTPPRCAVMLAPTLSKTRGRELSYMGSDQDVRPKKTSNRRSTRHDIFEAHPMARIRLTRGRVPDSMSSAYKAENGHRGFIAAVAFYAGTLPEFQLITRTCGIEHQ